MAGDKEDSKEDDKLPSTRTRRDIGYYRVNTKSKSKDTRLLKILIEEKALVKLLKTIGSGGEYPTRELLIKLGAYGYGHMLLLKAQKRGLVDRKTVKNKVFNKLTNDGKKIVKIAKEIGV
jgi:hypothetical protein